MHLFSQWKSKSKQGNYIRLKSFEKVKETTNKIKRQPSHGERYLKLYSQRRFFFSKKKYKEFNKLNTKKQPY